jgi:Mrp family chromosome partitioning ATPase/uncharacterized protein involved in exopolysaccharide biosynthesis
LELVFVIRAIRRYWYLAVAGALGALLMVLAWGPSRQLGYESEAWLLISPPGEQVFTASITDRAVQNQLFLLGSTLLAEQVTDRVDTTLSPAQVRSATTFEQIPGSDIVRVVANAPTPEEARDIADGYVDGYLDMQRSELEAGQQTEMATLEAAIEETTGQLEEVDAEIEDALAPYLQDGGEGTPTIDQVSPTLATQRQILLDRYFELVRSRRETEIAARGTNISGLIVQRASEAVPDTGGAGPLTAVLAVFAGGFVGILAAVALSRMSPRVLDNEEVSAIVARPVTALMDGHGRPQPAALLRGDAPPWVDRTTRALSVRLETRSPADTALCVVVTGAQRPAGVTTLALALARRFVTDGSTVLLVDADDTEPRISDLTGEPALAHHQLIDPDQALNLGPEAHGGGPAVVELSQDRGMRRSDLATLLERARAQADVVVVDAGTLLETAGAVDLARASDVVVLAVPTRHQRTDQLKLATQVLDSTLVDVVVVATSPRRRRSRRPGASPAPKSTTAAGSASENAPDDHQDEVSAGDDESVGAGTDPGSTTSSRNASYSSLIRSQPNRSWAAVAAPRLPPLVTASSSAAARRPDRRCRRESRRRPGSTR